MTPEVFKTSEAFVSAFGKAHLIDHQFARTYLMSAFITCYSMLSQEDRQKVMTSLFLFAKEISNEQFEDGQDFISFLREMSNKIGE